MANMASGSLTVVDTNVSKHQKCRQRKKNNDLAGYLAHNAEIKRKWRENNKLYDRNNLQTRLNNIKRDATRRKIPWHDNMTKEHCTKMVSAACHFCGTEPTCHTGFHGIDRLDSGGTYSKANTVPCCKPCNKIKGSLDPGTFISRVKHISCINGGPGIVDYSVFRETHSASYTQYRNRALVEKSPPLEFELTIDDFKRLQLSPCKYCNCRGENGVDRDNNLIGYTKENSVPCCTDCNYAKGTMTGSDFVEHVKKIAALQTETPSNFPSGIPLCTMVKYENISQLRVYDDDVIYWSGVSITLPAMGSARPLIPKPVLGPYVPGELPYPGVDRMRLPGGVTVYKKGRSVFLYDSCINALDGGVNWTTSPTQTPKVWLNKLNMARVKDFIGTTDNNVIELSKFVWLLSGKNIPEGHRVINLNGHDFDVRLVNLLCVPGRYPSKPDPTESFRMPNGDRYIPKGFVYCAKNKTVHFSPTILERIYGLQKPFRTRCILANLTEAMTGFGERFMTINALYQRLRGEYEDIRDGILADTEATSSEGA